MDGAQILVARSRTSACEPAKAVLVVEDDDDLREMVLDVLWSHGYAATGAENGSDALAQLRAAPVKPRCVLLDLCMPVMDGYGFLAAQAGDATIADVPVIVMSAAPLGDLRPAWRHTLRKPMELRELLEAVRGACDERRVWANLGSVASPR